MSGRNSAAAVDIQPAMRRIRVHAVRRLLARGDCLSRLGDAVRRTSVEVWPLAALLALGACDPRDRWGPPPPAVPDPRPPPSTGGSTVPEADMCADPDADWYGCPGNPCAHGWCAEGQCVGMVVDADGKLVDPGVCCVDAECLAP